MHRQTCTCLRGDGFRLCTRSGNWMASRMKKTGMLLPTCWQELHEWLQKPTGRHFANIGLQVQHTQVEGMCCKRSGWRSSRSPSCHRPCRTAHRHMTAFQRRQRVCMVWTRSQCRLVWGDKDSFHDAFADATVARTFTEKPRTSRMVSDEPRSWTTVENRAVRSVFLPTSDKKLAKVRSVTSCVTCTTTT